jgi:hypothetical protein
MIPVISWGILRAANAQHNLTNNPSTIGRDPSCDVVIADPSISRQQARICLSGGRVEVVSTCGHRPRALTTLEEKEITNEKSDVFLEFSMCAGKRLHPGWLWR